jgi:hypothetical protein
VAFPKSTNLLVCKFGLGDICLGHEEPVVVPFLILDFVVDISDLPDCSPLSKQQFL